MILLDLYLYLIFIYIGIYIYIFILAFIGFFWNDTYTLNILIINMKRSSNFPAVLMRALIMEVKLKHTGS
jgi:hypothetical protein